MLILLGDTSKVIPFPLVLASDGWSPATGLSPAVLLSKNAGAFASPTGVVAEVAHGFYGLTPSAGDVGTLGPLSLFASVATAQDRYETHQVVSLEVYSGVWGTNLPGSYTGVQSGNVLGNLLSSLQARSVNVTSPVAQGGTITVYRGYAYQTAHNNAITFSLGATPALAGAVLTLWDSGPAASISTGSVSGTNPQIVTFELSSANTTALVAGTYTYYVVATFSAVPIQVFIGTLVVK